MALCSTMTVSSFTGSSSSGPSNDGPRLHKTLLIAPARRPIKSRATCCAEQLQYLMLLSAMCMAPRT